MLNFAMEEGVKGEVRGLEMVLVREVYQSGRPLFIRPGRVVRPIHHRDKYLDASGSFGQ